VMCAGDQLDLHRRHEPPGGTRSLVGPVDPLPLAEQTALCGHRRLPRRFHSLTHSSAPVWLIRSRLAHSSTRYEMPSALHQRRWSRSWPLSSRRCETARSWT
jgi:hypothetical protein